MFFANLATAVFTHATVLGLWLQQEGGGAVGFDNPLALWGAMGWFARAIVIILLIMSALSIAVMIGLAYLVLSYQQFGIATPQLGPLPGFLFMGALIVIGLAIFFIARFVRARQGINLDLIYKELPPE